MTDQGSLEVEVQEGTKRLEAAIDVIHAAIMRAGETKKAFERARMIAVAELEREYQERRMPAQDIREALIFPKLSGEWDAYFTAEYTRDAIERSSRVLGQVVSAKQSLLRSSRGTLG